MKARATDVPKARPDCYIDAGGFVHDMKEGRVQCNRCGSRVFSRNAAAIVQWQLAHTKYCRERDRASLPAD